MSEMTQAPPGTEASVRLPVSDLYCPCCADELEAALRANPHILDVKVDYAGDEVLVRYDAEALDEAGIQELLAASGL